MFRNNPKLPAQAAVAHGRAPRLAAFATDRFKQRVPGPHESDREQQLDRGNRFRVTFHSFVAALYSPDKPIAKESCREV